MFLKLSKKGHVAVVHVIRGAKRLGKMCLNVRRSRWCCIV